MPRAEHDTQQSRTERIGLAVTADEKRAVEFVAFARNLDGASLLFREMSLPEIVTEYQRLRRVIDGEANGGARGHEESEAVIAPGYDANQPGA